MASNASQTPIQAFYEYLGRRLDRGGADLTPEESIREFRLYQAEELKRFIDETQPAVEQSRRDETRPLSVDTVMQRVTERLQSGGGGTR